MRQLLVEAIDRRLIVHAPAAPPAARAQRLDVARARFQRLEIHQLDEIAPAGRADVELWGGLDAHTRFASEPERFLPGGKTGVRNDAPPTLSP